MDLTLSKVVEAARQRRAAVTAEVGGYIVLLLLQLQASGPRRISPELVGLTAAGEVELAPSPAAERREVEALLRELLALLLALSQSAPPALRASSERAATGDLAAFEAELTAALIPINHAASRRALARVFRETQKAQRAVGGAEQERDSAPVPASARAPEPSTPLPAPARAALKTPLPAPARAAPETPVPAARVSALEPLVSAAEPAPAELEIDVDVDVALPEPSAAAAPSPLPEPSAAAPALPERDDVELEVVAEVDLDELDQLLASEPPPSARAHEEEPLSAAAVEAPAAPVSLLHSLTPAARALTPLPASATRRSLAPHEAHAAQESAAPSSVAQLASEAELAPARSDLCELLAGYLSYTRREEEMAAGLRRMIGLEPWRGSGVGSERTGLGQ
ncbi:MAG TPA: hypothetical protein VFS67_33555 [Polyangiaceae bacterium]|nr:hypothetical protein [Polyangiaceae bacterium]